MSNITASSTSSSFKWATLALCAALLVYQLFHVMYGPIWRDDSVFASVAKNIAGGNGYAAVYFDGVYPHHFGITTGPVQILPTALLITLFGNQHWVPSLVAVILIWAIMAALFAATGKYLVPQERKWQCCFIFLLLALLFTAGGNNNFYIETGIKYSFWHLLLAQVQAGMMIVLGTFVLLGKAITRRTMLLGGLIMGIAILFKSLAAIGAVVCIAAAALKTLFSQNIAFRHKIGLVSWCVAGTAAPLIGFELLKLLSMGLAAYLDLYSQTFEYYRHIALNAPAGGNHRLALAANVSKQVVALFLMTGFLTTFILIPVIAYLFSTSLRATWPHRNHLNGSANCVFMGLVLLACFLAQTLWWLILAHPNSDRYMITAFIYLSAGIALIVPCLPKSKFGKELLTLFFILVPLENYEKPLALFYTRYAQPDDQLTLQLNAVSEIEKLRRDNVPFYSCTTNFELEYLLSGNGNFRDCKQLLSAPERSPAVLASYYLEPDKILITEPKGRYYAEFAPLSEEIKALCPDVFFWSGRTELRWCNKHQAR